MANPRDDRYGSIGKYRRSPPEFNAHGGPYVSAQGGRTVLPPLTTAFPTFSYPGQQQNLFPSRASPSRNETLSPSYGHVNWPISSHLMTGHQTYSYAPHEHDQRYPPQSSYPSYPTRQSPGGRLPPLSIPQPPREERWPANAFYSNNYPTASTPHGIPHGIPPSNNVRSPIAAYPNSYDPYSNQQSHAFHPPILPAPDARHLPPPMSFHHDNHHAHHAMPTHSEWLQSTLRTDTHGGSPYTRAPPDALSSSRSPESDSPIDFPVIKKKRKRADATQLKALNDVFDRTAFPTTEERHDLANRLDMTPRSVQIWFQNKRQSTRLNRTSSNSLPPIVHHPYPASTLSSTTPVGPHLPNMGGSSGEVMVNPASLGGSYTIRSPVDSSAGMGHAQTQQYDLYRSHSRARSPEDTPRARQNRMSRPSY